MISYPFAVQGVATRVLEAGTSGPPVVFVHGTGGRAERWERNLDAAAAAGYHAYAFDLPVLWMKSCKARTAKKPSSSAPRSAGTSWRPTP
jgi:pimeloyl-ACP methyl ester carboxylesterase